MTKNQVLDFITETIEDGVKIKVGKYFKWLIIEYTATFTSGATKNIKVFRIDAYKGKELIIFTYHIEDKELKFASMKFKCTFRQAERILKYFTDAQVCTLNKMNKYDTTRAE